MILDDIAEMQRIARPPGPTSVEDDQTWGRRVAARTRLAGYLTRLEGAGFLGCFERRALLERYGYSLKIVVRSLWEADHVIPLVLGGTNELSNFRTVCKSCHKAATARLSRFRITKPHAAVAFGG